MNNPERVIGTIKKDNQQVKVVKVEKMIGYRFDAIGKGSLPLAVDLAVKQAQGKLKIGVKL